MHSTLCLLLLLLSVTSAFVCSTSQAFVPCRSSKRDHAVRNQQQPGSCDTPASLLLLHASGNGATDGSAVSGRRLVFQGMEAFRAGQVTQSVGFFDEAAAAQPSIEPYLWQRGISLYYQDSFEDASRQFRTDVRVNPSDVEEIVWDIACLLRMNTTPADSKKVPPVAAMALPAGKTDSRRIMGPVYRLFQGQGSEQELAMAGHTSQSPADAFYALFYLGLFAEAVGETSKASMYMQQAIQTTYALVTGRGDYMTTVARIHCQLRGWT